MKSVRDIPVLHDIPVLVRAALNVPFVDGKVAGTYRLQRALPTLEFLRSEGARVVVVSHIGEQGTETLAPVAEELNTKLRRVTFCPTSIGEEARAAVRALHPGDIVVLENLRRHPGEVKNDPKFAKELAHLGDVFVQDSFDTCHRKHASIVGVPTFLPSYAGLILVEEERELRKALTPEQPALAIIGGAKFSTKQPVITKLLANYDTVFVGGALANDFFKASGISIGASLCSATPPEGLQKLQQNPKVRLPLDVRVRSKDKQIRVRKITEIEEGEYIVDHGPQTEELLVHLVSHAKTVLWNGPLGEYEHGYTQATDVLARAMAASTARSIIGGGDTGTEVEKLGLLDDYSFVSTGGGAMLEFLASGTLPGIAALK